MPAAKGIESKLNVSASLKNRQASKIMAKIAVQPSVAAMQHPKHHCYKCFLMKCFWMVTVNMYDFMGLIDICPSNTLHAVKPYVSCKV